MILETVSTSSIHQVTPQVKKLLKVMKGTMTRDELQLVLDLKDRKCFREHYLKPALDAGLIEMTIPDKPNSLRQCYRLISISQALFSLPVE